MARILIIDDDELICDMLSRMVRRMGHDAEHAVTLREGLNKAYSGIFDVVFLDVHMPDGNGLEEIPSFRESPSHPEVIIITGAGDADGAELAIKSGAWDYIQKGAASIRELALPLTRVLDYLKEKRGKKPPVSLTRTGIIGESRPIRDALDLVSQAADSLANVLITGETGTGKELFARAIHENSPRKDRSLVVVDCTALPETLVEGILFGHAKGAYTGADRTQEGLIKQADDGTLFLDEIGELPMSVQKTFLRVLQEHRFRPVGGQKEEESDFRLVAATNRNLDKMAKQGLFRQDLLFRLRALTIELPPLREHPEDIPELAMYHMAKLCQRYGEGTKGFSPEFMDSLAAYDWPGNVRELVNTLSRALAAARDEPTLFRTHLPPEIRIQVARRSFGNDTSKPREALESSPPPTAFPRWKDAREAWLNKLERRYLKELLTHTQGDIQTACEISGLKRSRLYQLLNKHELAARG